MSERLRSGTLSFSVDETLQASHYHFNFFLSKNPYRSLPSLSLSLFIPSDPNSFLISVTSNIHHIRENLHLFSLALSSP